MMMMMMMMIGELKDERCDDEVLFYKNLQHLVF